MNENKLVIGLDVGTTGVKAIICDKDGKIYGRGYREYPLHSYNNGKYVEQNAEDWYSSSVDAIREASKNIDASIICALSLSTQGASMTAVDRDFKPIMPVITWMDQRSEAEAYELANLIGRDKLYHYTGWDLDCSCDLPKLLWLKRNMPKTFDAAYSFPTTLEYMNCRLTGNNVTDPSNAAIRMLLNLKTKKYEPELLAAAGIDEDKLPSVLPAGAKVGNLTREAAEALGLSEKTEVYNGAHDQYASSLGSGAIKISDMLVATGTTWVVLGVLDRLIYSDSGIAPGVHPIDGLYGAMGSLVSAGSALKWYKSIIGDDYAVIDKNAEDRRDSAKNLLFRPYLAGCGFPNIGKNLPAGILGLTLENDRYDIARALMEGVAFEVRTVLEEFAKSGCPTKKLIMTGRTAHSSLWRGLVRDITNCEISVTAEPDTGCVGAAMIAAYGAGLYSTLSEAALSMIKPILTDVPIPENVEFYNEKYERYKNFYYPLGKE